MKTLSDFNSFFESDLIPQLEPLEQQRKQVLNPFVAAIILVIVGLASFGLAAVVEAKFIFLVPVIILLFSFLQFSKYSKARKNYNEVFKRIIIKELIKFVMPELYYESGYCIPQANFVNSEIFRERIDRYRGDDCVSGIVDKTAFRFSELHAEQKQITYDNKGRARETWVTIFRGIFFMGDFNKNFHGKTVVLPDQAESFLGGIFSFVQKFSAGRGELVKLENVDFEKEFVTYSNDQVEARYILSPALMERILKFRKEANGRIFLSFVDSSVFVAIPVNKNLFEANVFSSALKKDYIQEYFFYLELAVGLVEDLNLNTRIWTKE